MRLNALFSGGTQSKRRSEVEAAEGSSCWTAVASCSHALPTRAAAMTRSALDVRASDQLWWTLWSAVHQKNCHPVGAVWKIHTKNTSTTKGKGNCQSVASGLQQTLLLGIFFFSSPSVSVFLPSVSYTASKQNILLYNLRPLCGFTSYSSLKVTHSTHFFIHIFIFHLGLRWRSLTGLITL